MHFATEASLGGIVFEEVSEVVGRDEVVDGHDFESFVEESLFDDCTKNKPTDAAKSIDTYCCHGCCKLRALSNLEVPKASMRNIPPRFDRIWESADDKEYCL